MKRIFVLLIFLTSSISLQAELKVGAAVADLTPPIGTPSAGYDKREGEGMEGVHDQLLATALVVEQEGQRWVLCGVDHLGFDFRMVSELRQLLITEPGFENAFLLVGSSHTHSGGGAYLDIPVIGEMLAGKYSPEVRQSYIQGALRAITKAGARLQPGRLGVSYCECPGWNRYRGKVPEQADPRQTVTILTATDMKNQPLAVWFNYTAHPTTLRAENRQFSADFVGYARDEIQHELGEQVVAIYFNGAQGDVVPSQEGGDAPFEQCESMGRAIGSAVAIAARAAEVTSSHTFEARRKEYTLDLVPTVVGTSFPFDTYPTELNLLTIDQHLFVGIPGELSCVLDAKIGQLHETQPYEKHTILGLCNDAHGYIITSEAWHVPSTESAMSFGGPDYSDQLLSLLQSELAELTH